MKWLSYCCLILFFSCGDKEETISPTVQGITESVYASGIVKSDNQYQVYSPVNGIVQKVHKQEGELVTVGDALFTLSNEASALNVQSAQLSADYAAAANNQNKLADIKIAIDQSKAKMEIDSLLLQRQRNLWLHDIGSRNDLEQRELAFKNSSALYRSSILQYKEAKKQIHYTAQQAQKAWQVSKSLAGDYIVRSKRNGRVYSIAKEPGEMVVAQAPIAEIGSPSQFTIELQIDEYDITKVKAGQKLFISMDSYEGQVFEGIVDEIDPIMDPQRRSFCLKAKFKNAPERLYPNLNVEANIVVNKKEKALTIPRGFLIDNEFVLLKNNKRQKVTTGLEDYDHVEIVSGLTKNDILKRPQK